ncbi:MAG: hypothetical protein K2O23_04300 [Anaeroplasmataceae bacterium]|nr:hypothetical protein [Anaeroplasmataceae bacterium]
MRKNLDEEKDFFWICIWLLPLVPQICLMIILSIKYYYFYWQLLVTSILWFFIIGYVYYFFHTIIIFDKDKIKIQNRRKIREIYFSQILYIEETYKFNNPHQLHRFELFFQKGSMKKSLFIRNKKVQKDINLFFKDVKIIKKAIID